MNVDIKYKKETVCRAPLTYQSNKDMCISSKLHPNYSAFIQSQSVYGCPTLSKWTTNVHKSGAKRYHAEQIKSLVIFQASCVSFACLQFTLFVKLQGIFTTVTSAKPLREGVVTLLMLPSPFCCMKFEKEGN